MLQKIGLGIFVIALIIFSMIPAFDQFDFSAATLQTDNEYHQAAISTAAENLGMEGKHYDSKRVFLGDFKKALLTAQADLNERAASGLPDGVGEWDFKIGNWKIKDYTLNNAKGMNASIVGQSPMMYWLLTIGLGMLGGLLYIIPVFQSVPGIWRSIFLGATILGMLIWGVYYMNYDYFWSALTLGIAALITVLVFFVQKSKGQSPQRSAGPSVTGYLGVFAGTYLILFYVLLYWAPENLTGWMLMSDPLSKGLSGNGASQWFVYGMLYTVIMLVMGVRMIAKYRHNKYQIVRTISVVFFQTAFAFLIPEILVKLNQPYFDFKNIWPLDYDFFFSFNLDNLINNGGLGMFMLVWGIALIVIAVPVITYFFGKRWYCSWVCGCGGLAETMGDPYRQLSDKSLRAWQYERWIIHGVMVFAVVMTGMTLYTYFSGSYSVLGFDTGTVQKWYGFLIGSAFAGVVGTGFYPLMGNRVWCRFGCPLSGYLGLVQRFKSRFRITTNGSQCISCGNCSTYCEMGIDVRSYAQKGQDIVRASCVGCGVCAAVCPRGVLRLENGPGVGERTEELRTVHIGENEVTLLS